MIYFENRIYLFTFPLDVEILSDSADIYKGGWSSHFTKCFEDNYKTHTLIQNVEVGYTHTIAANSANQLFSWGWNDFGQLGVGPVNKDNNNLFD